MASEIRDAGLQDPDAEAQRVHDEYRRFRADRRTGLELYFSTSPVPPDAPVDIFQHAMKSAGTAFRALLYANLSLSATLVGYVAPKSAKEDDLAAWYRTFFEQFSVDEQSRLLWAAGHTAAYLAPLIRRPVRLFTIVRRPVDLVLSRHLFAGFRSMSPEEVREQIVRLQLVYASPRTVGKRRHQGYWNYQSQSLLAPYYDVMALQASKGPTADADVWRQRLRDLVDRSCVLILQDRLDDGVRWFGAEQQWRVATVPRVRVNPGRPATVDLDPELRASIEAYNWLDQELYQLAARQHEQRRAAANR